jgi:hypothetical protein
MWARTSIDPHRIGSEPPAKARDIAVGCRSYAGRVHIRGPLRRLSRNWSCGGGGGSSEVRRLIAESSASYIGASRVAQLYLLLLELSFEVFLVVIHFGRRKIKNLRGFPFVDV